MIREQSPTVTNSYVYGIDLSGSMQGAGTIGGILSADLNGTTAFYCYDANGNVTDLVDANGNSVAHYEYGPFGGTITQSGSLADDNPFRFSSKYLDEDVELYYYGLRYYSPELGRWVNRDPIGENGGVNLYLFCFNNPQNSIDGLGDIPIYDGDGLTWDLDWQQRPFGHPDFRGALGNTLLPSRKPGPPNEDIKEVGRCCAEVVTAEGVDMLITVYVPNMASIGQHFTHRGWLDVNAHERRRARVYLNAFRTYYGPVTGRGSAATKCGRVCRKEGSSMAKILLSDYLGTQKNRAWSQFIRYSTIAQTQISRDNRNWRPDVIEDGRTLIDGYSRTFTADPPTPFNDEVPCPTSNGAH
jgi:RHS repeat-associated protein